MSILFVDGFAFETNGTALARRYDYVDPASPDVDYRYYGRDGDYCLKSKVASTALRTPDLSPANPSICGLHFGLNCNVPADNTVLFAVATASGAQEIVKGIVFKEGSGWRMHVRNGKDETLHQTQIFPYSLWLHFQILFVFSTTAGRLDFIVDEVLEASLSGLDVSGAGNEVSWESVKLGLKGDSETTHYMAIDDLVITDDGLQGDLHVEPLYITDPSFGPVSTTQPKSDWTRSSGSSSHYDYVNDSTGGTIDDDATYLQSSSAGEQQLFHKIGSRVAKSALRALVVEVDARDDLSTDPGLIAVTQDPETGAVSEHGSQQTVAENANYLKYRFIIEERSPGQPWLSRDLDGLYLGMSSK